MDTQALLNLLIGRLKKSFSLTFELVKSLPEKSLESRLSSLPSNKIGKQLWCIIGARESYLNAIKNDGWSGFSCSLENTKSKSEVLECLLNSEKGCVDYLNSADLNENKVQLLFDLLEHEIQHHGQLIRFVYGNNLEFPKSWKIRYTV